MTDEVTPPADEAATDELPLMPPPTTWVREDDVVLAEAALQAKRDHSLRIREQDIRDRCQVNTHNRVLAAIWAPVVLFVVLSFFGMLAFMVHQISTEHSKADAHKVEVWCHPNADNGYDTNVEGRPEDVRDICR